NLSTCRATPRRDTGSRPRQGAGLRASTGSKPACSTKAASRRIKRPQRSLSQATERERDFLTLQVCGKCVSGLISLASPFFSRTKNFKLSRHDRFALYSCKRYGNTRPDHRALAQRACYTLQAQHDLSD